jgi:hypothetical protein
METREGLILFEVVGSITLRYQEVVGSIINGKHGEARNPRGNAQPWKKLGGILNTRIVSVLKGTARALHVQFRFGKTTVPKS